MEPFPRLAMPFQSIEPRRLYRQIAEQIRGLIRSGEYLPGARLPPERDLAKQLGVSRPRCAKR
jgi:DNA-binding FadR family transcriptional regulator